MSERKQTYDLKLIKIGNLFKEKRKIIFKGSREGFINDRSELIFNNDDWISLRHLSNIEEGKNLPSIEMLIKLSYALEVDAIDLFQEIFDIMSER